MSVKTDDHLYRIFEIHLLNEFIEEESEDTFVVSVVDQYIDSLKKTASLPLAFIDDIREDTANEVYNMLLKKVYGHFSLQHYRNSLNSEHEK